MFQVPPLDSQFLLVRSIAMPNNTTCSSSNYYSAIRCGLDDADGNENGSHFYPILSSYIIIVVLSPVAVVGNALIVITIWRRTFQRTPFHILLSGLAFTDLCTGLIAQPFTSAHNFLRLVNRRIFVRQPVLVLTIEMIARVSTVYFVSMTLLIMTLMSVERWLVMSRRSLSSKRRRYITFTVLLFVPIAPSVLNARSIEGGRRAQDNANILIAACMLVCYLITSLAYFNVFRIIRQHQQQIQGNQSSQTFGQPAINLAKYKRSVVSILYILAVFSFCFLPMIVFLVISYALVGDSEMASSVSLVLLFLASSLNPFLYFWRMNDIRIGVKQLLCPPT